MEPEPVIFGDTPFERGLANLAEMNAITLAMMVASITGDRELFDALSASISVAYTRIGV